MSNGTIVQDMDDKKVYFVFGNKRHYVTSPETLEALGLAGQIKNVSGAIINSITKGDDMPTFSSKLVQKSSTGQVYFLEAGKRRYVPDPETLKALDVHTPIQGMSDAAIEHIPLGEPVPSIK